MIKFLHNFKKILIIILTLTYILIFNSITNATYEILLSHKINTYDALLKSNNKENKIKLENENLKNKKSNNFMINSSKKTDEIKIDISINEKIFIINCYFCHFEHSNFKMAKKLHGKEFWQKYTSDDKIKHIIRNGIKTLNGDMPAFNDEILSDDEVNKLIEYLKNLIQPIDYKK